MMADANLGAVLALLEAGFPDYAEAVLVHGRDELPEAERAARVEIRRIILAGDTVEAIHAVRALLARAREEADA